jgi:hypothetical protein
MHYYETPLNKTLEQYQFLENSSFLKVRGKTFDVVTY